MRSPTPWLRGASEGLTRASAVVEVSASDLVTRWVSREKEWNEAQCVAADVTEALRRGFACIFLHFFPVTAL